MTYWMISSLDSFLFRGMLGTRSFSLVRSSVISSPFTESWWWWKEVGEGGGEEEDVTASAKWRWLLCFITLFSERDLDLGDMSSEVGGEEGIFVITREKIILMFRFLGRGWWCGQSDSRENKCQSTRSYPNTIQLVRRLRERMRGSWFQCCTF